MPKIRVAIIDDEPVARERVRRLLMTTASSGGGGGGRNNGDDLEIEIIGEAGDGFEAVSIIKKKLPDLIFLDVQMPGKDGFDVLMELKPDEMPVVVFITAFDHYAVKAFEDAALDYLLKPFDEERFNKALARAKAQLQIQSNEQNRFADPLSSSSPLGEIFKAEGADYLERILVKKDGKVFFFQSDEIEWIEAYGNYVKIHFVNAVYLLREAISSLETQLDPKKFARVHRSGLINLQNIREIHTIFGGRAKIVLHSGSEIIASRHYYRKLQKMLES